MTRPLRFVSVCLFAAALLVPGIVGAESDGKFRGTWSLSMSKYGASVRAGGKIGFNVDSQNGSFTCTVTGTGTISGVMTRDGMSVPINGSETIRSSSCSGSYNPDTGVVDGALTITENRNVTMQVPTGERTDDGEPVYRSQTNNSSSSWPATIYGRLGNSGGRGELVDDEGTPATWSVTGGFGPTDEEVQAEYDEMVADMEQYMNSFSDYFSEQEFIDLSNYTYGLDRDASDYLADIFGDIYREGGDNAVRNTGLDRVLEGVEDKSKRAAIVRTFNDFKMERNDPEFLNLAMKTVSLTEKNDAANMILEQAKTLKSLQGNKSKMASYWDAIKEKTFGWTKDFAMDKVLPEKVKKGIGYLQTAKDKFTQIMNFKKHWEKAGKDLKKGRYSKFTETMIKGYLVVGNVTKEVGAAFCPGCGDYVDKMGDEAVEGGVKVLGWWGARSKETREFSEDANAKVKQDSVLGSDWRSR